MFLFKFACTIIVNNSHNIYTHTHTHSNNLKDKKYEWVHITETFVQT